MSLVCGRRVGGTKKKLLRVGRVSDAEKETNAKDSIRCSQHAAPKISSNFYQSHNQESSMANVVSKVTPAHSCLQPGRHYALRSIPDGASQPDKCPFSQLVWRKYKYINSQRYCPKLEGMGLLRES